MPRAFGQVLMHARHAGSRQCDDLVCLEFLRFARRIGLDHEVREPCDHLARMPGRQVAQPSWRFLRFQRSSTEDSVFAVGPCGLEPHLGRSAVTLGTEECRRRGGSGSESSEGHGLNQRGRSPTQRRTTPVSISSWNSAKIAAPGWRSPEVPSVVGHGSHDVRTARLTDDGSQLIGAIIPSGPRDATC